MKSCTKYIDEAIKKELKKLLKEAVPNPIKDAEEQVKYDEDQLINLQKDIKKIKNWEANAMSDIKGLQQQQRLTKDPIQKSISTTSLSKIAIPKEKDLKTMVSDKEEEVKNLEDKIKSDNFKLNFAKKGVTVPGATPASNVGTGEVTESQNKTSFPMLKRSFFTEQDEELKSNFPPIEGSNKVYLVKFDKNTQQPFDVKFTKRGFSIEGTRLGFETIENALSKNYIITLNGGKGFVLNPIRMQQILKYKDKWF